MYCLIWAITEFSRHFHHFYSKSKTIKCFHSEAPHYFPNSLITSQIEEPLPSEYYQWRCGSRGKTPYYPHPNTIYIYIHTYIHINRVSEELIERLVIPVARPPQQSPLICVSEKTQVWLWNGVLGRDKWEERPLPTKKWGNIVEKTWKLNKTSFTWYVHSEHAHRVWLNLTRGYQFEDYIRVS